MEFTTVLSRNPLYVKVFSAGYYIRAFIDTGSAVNLVTIDLIRLLGAENFINRAARLQYRGVGGEIKSSLGKIILTLHITPDLNIPVEFEVSERITGDEYLMLIGRKFLTELRANIDFGKFAIKLMDVEVPFLSLFEESLIMPDNTTTNILMHQIDNLKGKATPTDVCVLYRIISDMLSGSIAWNRNIKLTNPKVEAILRIPEGIELIESLGFEINRCEGIMRLENFNKELLTMVSDRIQALYRCITGQR